MIQRVFEALASEVRRGMLAVLAEGELHAGAIAERFEISKPAISQHLTVLEAAGLVERRKQGQYVFYRLTPESLTAALEDLLQQVRPKARAPEAAPAPAEPRLPASGVPVGFRWEAWRTRGNP